MKKSYILVYDFEVKYGADNEVHTGANYDVYTVQYVQNMFYLTSYWCEH